MRVEQFDYDAESDVIRITGRNATENKYLKTGQYQSLEIQAPKTLTLIKPVFDSMHVKKLNDAVNLENQGHVCAILMEDGIAHLFLVSRSTSKMKAKVEKRITKKKGIAAATGAHDKQKSKFYEQILQALILHFSQSPSWPTQLKSVIIASPGFAKDGFHQHLIQASESSINQKQGL